MRRAAGLVGAFAVIVASCAGSGLSTDDYASTVEARAEAHANEIVDLVAGNTSELNVAVARLQRDFEGEALAEAAVDETARLAAALFAGIGDALDRYVQDLDALDPPSELETDHRAYVVALEASRSGIAPLLSDLPAATTFDDIDRAIASSGFSDAQPRVVAACTTLERGIEARGPLVDLRCEATG
jgi:outer membrane murein-binding lipoprotein Lpp